MNDLTDNIKHICQNCGADLKGSYCKSVFAIISHFFEELFTWDSRFFQSIKYLFLKPGYLTHEYISGRHKRYISPLKMFLFTSFILFFVMIKSDPDQYKSLVTEGGEDNFMKVFILEEESNSGKSNELFEDEFNDQFNDNITLYIFFIMLIFFIYSENCLPA